MANPFSEFIRRLSGQAAQKAEATPKQSLVAFSESATYESPWYLSDLSLTQQIEQYKGWVYACTKKIAQEFAAVNLRLYQMDKKGEIIELDTHPALDLLDYVNEFTTLYDLKELTSSYLELTGNAYWWLVRNGAGQIIEIYPWLRPDRMNPIPSVKNFIKGYRYTVPGTVETITFEPQDIIHFHFINPKDPYVGASPVQAALMAIMTDEKSQRYNYRFFENQARPDGILQFKDGIEENQAKRIMEKWNELHGQGKEHKVAVLSKGEYKPIGLSQKDMDFLSSRIFGRDEILAMFNVPKSMLGITEDVNYATAEAARKMFLKQVIVPKFEKFVHYLNEFLLPAFDSSNSLFFDYDNPVPEDQEMRLRYYESGIQNSWLSPNEARKLENLDPYQGGDNVFIPFSLVPAGTVTEGTKGFINGQTRTLHIPKKFNVRHRSRSKDAQKEELIAKAMAETGLARRLAESKVKADSMSKTDSQRKDNLILQKDLLKDSAKLQLVWQKVWEQKINKTDNQERQFIMMLRREFTRQQDQVLKSLNIKALANVETKAASSFNFNLDEESQVFARIFEPILANIIRDHGADALGLLGRGNFNTGQATNDYLKSEGLKFAKEVNQVTKEAIKDQIAQGLEAGDGETQIRDRIQGVFKEASTGRAQSIARTEVSRSSNFGTKEGYRQSGVVTYTEWFTATDEAVCELCQPMHGKKAYLDANYFDKGDSFYGNDNKSIDLKYENVGDPPLHVNCRCVLIPHTDEAQFFDKEKAQDAFDLKGFDGSDADANANATEQVNQLMKKDNPEFKNYANQFDWKLQYADIDKLNNHGGALNETLVDQYVKDMLSGDKVPPIAAQLLHGSHIPEVLDGAHRMAALKKLGARIIPILIGRINL